MSPSPRLVTAANSLRIGASRAGSHFFHRNKLIVPVGHPTSTLRLAPAYNSRRSPSTTSRNLTTRRTYANMASATSFYDFKPVDKKGDVFPLSELKGKVVLVVNTASKCGFTPQFEGLEKLYKGE